MNFVGRDGEKPPICPLRSWILVGCRHELEVGGPLEKPISGYRLLDRCRSVLVDIDGRRRMEQSAPTSALAIETVHLAVR